MPSSPRKRVALLVETSLGSGREILGGIARYARQTGNWQIFHGAGSLTDPVPGWLDNWEGDAVIARIPDEATVERLSSLSIPVVDVLGICENRFPLVHVDDTAIAGLVSDYFEERSFRNLAFYGIAGENWSERRKAAFREACGEGVSFFDLEIERRRSRTDKGFRRLINWISSLPKPAGIMVCSDQRGLELLEACRTADVAVPEQVSVIGVDNDFTLCEISDPPLSSVKGGHFRVGFEAARLVDSLLDGNDAPREAILVPPEGICERESSSTRAISDPVVARGIRHIRENLAEPITNDSISRAVGVSRTLFQKKFRQETDQSIREFILGRRIERARLLIETTDVPLAEVACLCGFRHQEYLGQIIKQATGSTPGALRKLARQADGLSSAATS